MARPKMSEAYSIIQFFREQSIEIAELTFAMVRETMSERRSAVEAQAEPRVIKRRKRGPNKPKVQAATTTAIYSGPLPPRKPVDYNPDSDN